MPGGHMIHTECTVKDCEHPTQNYVCNQCIEDLQTHLEQIPELTPTLALIAKGQEKPFTQSGAIRHKTTGSQAPLNLIALSDLQDLQKLEGTNAQPYASDPDGAYHKHHIENLIKRTHRMVNGEKEDKPTTDYLNYRLNELHPLPAPHLAQWFADNLGIKISVNRIYKWAERGIIKPTRKDAHPTYHPAAAYIAYLERNRK